MKARSKFQMQQFEHRTSNAQHRTSNNDVRLHNGSMVSYERHSIPDKDRCDEMIRLGWQAYRKGKYLDAKEYFRKAVQSDPGVTAAWKFYDIIINYALAEKMEKDAEITIPGTPSPPPDQKIEFKIEEDEGC